MKNNITKAKGISPLLSAVIMIAIVFSLASIISPWLFNLTTDVANETRRGVEEQIVCQNAAYDFDSNFGTWGLNYSISGTKDFVDAKIVNTGTQKLYSFSFEIEINTGSGLDLHQIPVNSSYQKTKALPLKPGDSAILKANITQNYNGTLTEVKILNGVCASRFITQRV